MPCSYYTDPYLYNCRYDPVQDAIYLAESRAIAYAISKNVIVVAAGAHRLPAQVEMRVLARSLPDTTAVISAEGNLNELLAWLQEQAARPCGRWHLMLHAHKPGAHPSAPLHLGKPSCCRRASLPSTFTALALRLYACRWQRERRLDDNQ